MTLCAKDPLHASYITDILFFVPHISVLSSPLLSSFLSPFHHIQPNCVSLHHIKMPAAQSKSRCRNVTTTIRRKASLDPPVTITRNVSSTVGRRSLTTRISVTPSSAHQSLSTSAPPPAPSLISTYSQDLEPPLVQWDLPTNSDDTPHPSNRRRKSRSAVCLTLPMYSICSHFCFS